MPWTLFSICDAVYSVCPLLSSHLFVFYFECFGMGHRHLHIIINAAGGVLLANSQHFFFLSWAFEFNLFVLFIDLVLFKRRKGTWIKDYIFLSQSLKTCVFVWNLSLSCHDHVNMETLVNLFKSVIMQQYLDMQDFVEQCSRGKSCYLDCFLVLPWLISSIWTNVSFSCKRWLLKFLYHHLWLCFKTSL